MAKFGKPKGDKMILKKNLTDFDELLTNLNNNKWIKLILGSVVSVGNILNAGKVKLNRADGFTSEFFNTLLGKVDSNKKSIFLSILLQIYQ